MDKHSKKVSVLMSTFNSEKYVSRSIEGILQQKYNDFELLIVDDNSSDNTYGVIKSYSDKNDNIRVYKNNLNLGLTKSLNFLISHSTGNFIARQDDDDISFPNRIQKQVSELERLNLDFCTTRAVEINSKRKIPGISYYLPTNLLLKFKNPFIHGTLLIKKEVLETLGGYDENFYYSQDLKLVLDLIKLGYKYKIINEVLYSLNLTNNISKNKFTQQKYYANCARKNIKPKLFL